MLIKLDVLFTLFIGLVLDVTVALGSLHCHDDGDVLAPENSLSCAVEGETAVSTGLNGVGKIMSVCSSRVPDCLLVGLTIAVGPLALLLKYGKWFCVSI